MNITSKKIGIIIIILFLFLIYFILSLFGVFEKNVVEAVSTKTEINELYENENPVDIVSILEQNVEENVSKEMIVEDIDLEYTTTYIENSGLPSGTIHVTQARN